MRKRKNDNSIIPKQDGRICGTICICQMTLVFSCVAIVYLSVAVYLPALRAFRSEIKSPVMCTTLRVDESGNSSSCSEWCLSKGSGTSKNRQIYVHLRQNGTSLIFNNCVLRDTALCREINFDKLQAYNCRTDKTTIYDGKRKKHKLIESNACENLNGLFHCFSSGDCYDVTEVLDCNSQNENLTRLTCGMSKTKRAEFVKLDCSEVQGVFECKKGFCQRVNYSSCGHDCGLIKMGDKNVVIMSDDQVMTMKCSSVWNQDKNIEVWDTSNIDRNFFMVSCLSFHVTEPDSGHPSTPRTLEAIDCVDGVTLMKEESFNVTESIIYMNLSQIYSNLTKNNSIVPKVDELTISSEAKLFINLEGCVNTLKDECVDFYRNHSSNGSNHNAVSRFNCFYSETDNSTAFLRFDMETEKRNFLFAFFIPSVALIVSCFTLICAQKFIRVGDDSKMRFKCSEETDMLNPPSQGSDTM